MKAALHVPESISWAACNLHAFDPILDKSPGPMQYVLPRVIEATNRTLIGGGDYDFQVLTNGTLMNIQNMTWNGKLGFQRAPS